VSCSYEYSAFDDGKVVSSPILVIEVAVSVRDVDEDRARKYIHHLRFDQLQAAQSSSLKDRKSDWARGTRLPQELPQEVGSHGRAIFKRGNMINSCKINMGYLNKSAYYL